MMKYRWKTSVTWASLFLGLAVVAASSVEAAPPDRPESAPVPAEPAPAENAGTSPVGVDADGLEHAYWVHLTQNGLLRGKLYRYDSGRNSLAAAQGATVRFVRDGRVVEIVEPDINGVFGASDIPPGTYSVLIDGNDGMAVFSIRVSDYLESDVTEPRPLEVLLTAPEDTPVVRAIAIRELPGLAVPPAAPLTAPPLPADPLIAPLTKPILPKLGEMRPGDAIASPISTPVLRISDAGEVLGRAVRLDPVLNEFVPVGRITLFIVRNGRMVSESPVNEDGGFRVRGLTPGIYTLVAAGPGGFAALAVKAIPQPPAAADAAPHAPNQIVLGTSGGQFPTRQVAFLQPPQPLDLEIPAVPAGDVQPLFTPGGPGAPPLTPPPFAPPAPFAAGMGGAAGGGAGGGFGGGGGGGGLLGALIGAGVGAGIGAALSNDDDNDDGGSQPPPSSPFIPPPAP